ncbi:MAG: NAD(P)/FAD-dependent oxidoreductase [Candidatus Cloacimonetes bacterium]|nr:NAD(P)/FAD-dependent oxidoreductase [Candidatus Cloacimonadota bacterium]
MDKKRKAIIIGAGPAGLTAAYEMLLRTDIQPVIYEMSDEIGGISRTVKYKGNRIDIGGHRFFSKSDRVMEWWQNILPLQGAPSQDDIKLNRDIPLSKKPGAPDPQKENKVLLIRNRISRIFFLRRFFSYPISLNMETILNLGIWRCIKIGISYFWIRIFPIRPEKSLADFYINRFGSELYKTFFRDYTTKVWGITPDHISPEWGAQRVKGLSISRAIIHAVKSLFKRDTSIGQKGTETSLIEQFTYPKHGPGQMWETVAELVQKDGAELYMKKKCTAFIYEAGKINGAEITDIETGEKEIVTGDFYFSTMPVKDLILGMGNNVPKKVKDVAKGLLYRDFITVGLLLKKLKVKNKSPHKTVNDIVPDNWIYIQERDVIVGRVQVFNNWSPYLVADANNVWLGLEYFLNDTDDMWKWEDQKMAQLGIDEMVKIDIIDREDVLDSVVIRTAKTYPAYFGSYNNFDTIRDFVDTVENLFMVGRNGLHRYNNQDHSMLTAMTAVDNLEKGILDKTNIWEVNTETEYHEAKKGMSEKLKKS